MLLKGVGGLRKIMERFGPRFERHRLDTPDVLADFLRTRSSYVAQTSLYGYLKTRMGTSYRTYFEDDAFSASIRMAAAKLFLSCLADLTVFAAALAERDGALPPGGAAALAARCFRQAAERGLADAGAGPMPAEALARLDLRLRATDWPAAAEGRHAFAGSEADLVRFAPVIDEYKALDREIVMNSIRFRWRDVRDQLRRRLDAAALGGALRRDAGAAADC